MTKIAVISVYEPFVTYARQVEGENPGVKLDIFRASKPDEVMRCAKQCEKQGYDIILSRGFPSHSMETKIGLPVISVEPSLLDLIDGFLENKHLVLEKKRTLIFLTEWNDLFKQGNIGDYLEQLFGIPVSLCPYSNYLEYIQQLTETIRSTDVVFGGQMANNMCRRNNWSCVLIKSGLNVFRNCVKDAVRLDVIKKADQFKRRQLEALLGHAHSGLMYIDGEGNIELINAKATVLLKTAVGIPRVGHKYDLYLPELRILLNGTVDTTGTNHICRCANGQQVLLNLTSIREDTSIRGYVVTLKEAEEIISAEKQLRINTHKKGNVAKYTLGDIIGDSVALNECKKAVLQMKSFDVNVLICGETGTGKELFAQAIHNESQRKSEGFHAVNCAAISPSLLESELFGYSDGAFTGAKKGGKSGLLEIAHNGTLYLDEIGEMSAPCQSMLLRAIQEREVRRIGDDKVTPINVRIIAATNRDLYQESREGRFRIDLFYRLNTVMLTIPPLRERVEDIPILLDVFMSRFLAQRETCTTFSFDTGALAMLQTHSWEGNIRELENFVQRIIVNYLDEAVENRPLNRDDVMKLLPIRTSPPQSTLAGTLAVHPLREETEMAIIQKIEEAIAQCSGNQTQAAKLLGVSRTYLWRKLNRRK